MRTLISVLIFGLLGGTTALVAAGPASAASCVASPEIYPTVAAPSALPWAQQRLGFQRAWPITEGAGQVVAVVDSGVDTGNPQLPADALIDGGDSAVGSGSALHDMANHGTLVAGIIAARPQAGTAFAGVAPQARIYAVRAAECPSDIPADAIADGILDAIGRAGVINVSISTTNPDARLRYAVQAALAANVVVVASAGNNQTAGDAPEYPAAYPGVLSVGSVDEQGSVSAFSSTGTPVSVVAPGTDIVSTGSSAEPGPLVGGNPVQGTSFAAPFAAGAAALVRAAHPDLDEAEVVRRIEATADHPAGPLPDPAAGWGTLDPYAAVTAVLPGESGTKTRLPRGGALALPDTAAAPRPAADRTAEWIVGGALAGVVLLAGAAAATPAGRRRRWRPAR